MVYSNGMKEMLVPIDHAGRIVLPKGVREELAVRSGDKFKVCVQGASITLTPSKEAAGLVRRGQALVFASPVGKILGAETVDDLLQASRAEAGVRVAKGLKPA